MKETNIFTLKYVNEFGDTFLQESSLTDDIGVGGYGTYISFGEKLNVFLKQCGYVRDHDLVFMESITEDEYDQLAECLSEIRNEEEVAVKSRQHLTIGVRELFPDSSIPTRGSKSAAGMDLFARLGDESGIIEPGATVKVGTGIAVEIPEGYYGAVYARSGLATKQGLRPANCVGIIDSDYRGEIFVALHNDSQEQREISNGERIAQIVIAPQIETRLEVREDLSYTDRADGGFGSTGSM